MCFFLKICEDDWLKPKRLVFETEREKKHVTKEAALDPEDADEDEEENELDAEEEEKKGEIKREGEEKRQKLREEIDETGETKEYINTFKTSPQLPVVLMLLEDGVKNEGRESRSNFENWLTYSPEIVADIFDLPFFPRGKGRKAFIQGLDIENEPDDADQNDEAKKFRESDAALTKIVEFLRQEKEKKQATVTDMREQDEKAPMGLQTLSDGVKTLMKNFNRGSGTEKAMILGAVGAGIWLISKYWNSTLFKDFKVKDAATWSAAIFGVNYLLGKASKDGKTPLQRFDLGLDIENLNDENVLKAFASKNKMDEHQEQLRALVRLQTTDVRELFRLYQEASIGDKTIDPTKLGLKKNDVDGKAIYKIIEALVKDTAINQGIQMKKEEALRTWLTYTAEEQNHDLNNPDPAWIQPAMAEQAFEDKYFVELADISTITLVDAAFNEYQTRDWQKIIRGGRESRLLPRAARKGKETAVSLWKNYGEPGVEKVVKIAGIGYTFSRDNIFSPFGDWAKAQYKKIGPTIERPFKKAIDWWKEDDLRKVFPEEFSIDVIEGNKVTIMGYPGFPFRVTTQGGVEKAIIHDGEKEIELPLAAGVDGNKALTEGLKTKIQERVTALLKEKTKNNAALQGKTPEWDPENKKWVIADVAVEANTLTGLPESTKEVTFVISKDAKEIMFYMDGREIKDFGKLNEVYRDSVIEKALKKAINQNLPTYLADVPIEINDVQTDATYGSIIQGKLAGLPFKAVRKKDDSGVLKPLTAGLDFCDDNGIPPPKDKNSAELLKIPKNSTGREFVAAIAANIEMSADFLNPFLKLEAQMDQVKEGFFRKIDLLFPTTRLWIIPTSLNLQSGINGKVLQRQWKYTLDFKKQEALYIFMESLGGKTVNDIDASYKEYIEPTIQHLKNLSADIEKAGSDELRADRFQEYLSGQGITGQTDGLEYVNYPSKSYRKLYREYQTMIQKFNYEGLETLSDVAIQPGQETWGAADDTFEIYAALMRVWNYHTGHLAHTDPLPPTDEQQIRQGLIEKVKDTLTALQQKGGGKIKLADLPDHKNSDELDKWVNPQILLPNRKRTFSL